MITLPSVTELIDIRGKRVLTRLDLNVPLDGGKIRDPYRIEKALRTVNFLRDAGARVMPVGQSSGGAVADGTDAVQSKLATDARMFGIGAKTAEREPTTT